LTQINYWDLKRLLFCLAQTMRAAVFRSDHIAESKAAGYAPSAALYITKLPKAEHEAAEWQSAMEALILVATLGGPTMFARIGTRTAPQGAKAYRVIR
jgi:hypothetical protein